MMRNSRWFCYFFFLISWIPILGFAWSATGHRVIAQIAYDKLTPRAKRTYAHLNQYLNQDQRQYNLITAAVWMDTLYDPRYLSFKPMHYIDIPESVDGTPVPKAAKMNAVVAIQQAIQTLQNPNAPLEEQAIALRIILHVVGDIHQPLHTITRVSKAYPQGDRGGNDFHLGKNPVGNNLHRYWDKGGGLLQPKISRTEVKRLASDLEAIWPCPEPDSDIMHWVEASHALALQHAYAIEENTVPSEKYTEQTQIDTEQQLVYAGCRLAVLLNDLAEK